MRFLKAIDGEKFADGVRQTLSDDEISMAFWLSTGFPPQLRLKDLRAGSRGELSFDLLLIQLDGLCFTTNTNCSLSAGVFPTMVRASFWENNCVFSHQSWTSPNCLSFK